MAEASGLVAGKPAEVWPADTTVESLTGATRAEHGEPVADRSVVGQAGIRASALSPAAATVGAAGGTPAAATLAAATSTAPATAAAATDDVTAGVGLGNHQRLRIGWHTTSMAGLARLSSLVDESFAAAARRPVPAPEAAPDSLPQTRPAPPMASALPALAPAAAPRSVEPPPEEPGLPGRAEPARTPARRLAMIPTVVVAGVLAFAVAVWAAKGLKEHGAEAGPTEICLPSECVAWAGFTASTKVLKVCDNRADSLVAVVIYTIGDSTTQRRLWDSGGAGDCSESTLDVAEGTAVTYRVCSGDRSEDRIEKCSRTVTNYT